MGQRSRKRRTTSEPAPAPSRAPGAPRPSAPRAAPAAPQPTPVDLAKPADPNAQMKRGYARSEARNEAIRQNLEPLAPGERPTAVTVAAIVGLLFTVGNLVAAALSDQDLGSADWRFVAIQTVVLAIATVGMWFAKYWAVLGFQALLGLAVILAFLALLRASNVQALLYCVLIIAGCGTLFWYLIRAMARLQLPPRPGAS